MKKNRRSRKNKNDDVDNDKESSLKTETTGTSLWSKDNLLAAVTVVGIAYLALPLMLGGRGIIEPLLQKGTSSKAAPQPFKKADFKKSTAATAEDRLLEEWQVRGVEIRTLSDGSQGLFATRDVPQGQVITAVRFSDLEEEIAREHPTLRTIVENALKAAVKTQGANWYTLTSSKVMSLLQFLLEVAEGEASIWHSFIESLPRNTSDMAWYWTDEEKACVVPRPGSDSLYQDLNVYMAVMEEVRQNFSPLAEIYDRQRIEWAYLMLKSRGFGQYFLPGLHMANHNPLKSVPAFIIQEQKTAAYVASQDIKAGDPVYANYGDLSPVVAAEQYGFVEDDAVFFEVPSILEDMLQGERTKNEPLCTQESMKFFGNVTTQVVGTKFLNAKKYTYFKAYMPSELAYACVRVLLQTERDTDVAYYIVEKLQLDLKRYEAMLNATNCQSSEGNFPIIQKANRVTASLMRGALEVAEQGRDWKIPYPDIPSYKMAYDD